MTDERDDIKIEYTIGQDEFIRILESVEHDTDAEPTILYGNREHVQWRPGGARIRPGRYDKLEYVGLYGVVCAFIALFCMYFFYLWDLFNWISNSLNNTNIFITYITYVIVAVGLPSVILYVIGNDI